MAPCWWRQKQSKLNQPWVLDIEIVFYHTKEKYLSKILYKNYRGMLDFKLKSQNILW